MAIVDLKFAVIRETFFKLVEKFFKILASFLGYPKVPGMPVYYEEGGKFFIRNDFLASLPIHETSWPPEQRPSTGIEAIFGALPEMELIPRQFYESPEEGYFNFYIIHYQNMYFLPDIISRFIQIQFDICIDITVLEVVREILFISLVSYCKLVMFRTTLYWFMYINPYGFPIVIIPALVDWAEDLLQGFIPVVLGVNISSSVVLGILGIITDSLNCLVFTMPFLPSEGKETKVLIGGELTNVIVFNYLPILWYRYPIPNEVREYWYNNRPEIIEYLQKAYSHLDIQFLPDNVIETLFFIN